MTRKQQRQHKIANAYPIASTAIHMLQCDKEIEVLIPKRNRIHLATRLSRLSSQRTLVGRKNKIGEEKLENRYPTKRKGTKEVNEGFSSPAKVLSAVRWKSIKKYLIKILDIAAISLTHKVHLSQKCIWLQLGQRTVPNKPLCGLLGTLCCCVRQRFHLPNKNS